MKKFTKKSILQKTTIVILMVLSFNFIVPTYSSAGVGGVLVNPILDLAASLVDAVETLLQWSMTGQAEGDGFKSIFDSKIMVDQGDPKIKTGGGSPTISVELDDLDLGWFTDDDEYQVPVIEYTPEEIFANKVPYLDINFISPKWDSSSSAYGVEGSASRLQGTISSWYVALRNLSIVALLCILVYVGIRIILSSTSSDKAKYKQMFTDWIIALCLLFFLHYIMSFTLVMVDSITEAIGGNGYTTESVVISVDGTTYQTNFMGAARFMVQAKDTIVRLTYLLIYCALVAYTVIFTWHYLKRLLMMAFLTIIAPLVAITYPIDKMGDGKAQAFSMWLKEYVFNAIVQPFHLIIYMVFVGSAMDLAKSNFLYSLAAIAFILPAEKFLKHMFGFDKAPLGTMGALTGFTLGSLASKAKGGKKSAVSSPDTPSENKQPRYQRNKGIDGIDSMPDSSGNASQTSTSSGTTNYNNRGQTGNNNNDDGLQNSSNGGYNKDKPINVDYREVQPESRGLAGPIEQAQSESGGNNEIPRLSEDDFEEMSHTDGSQGNGSTDYQDNTSTTQSSTTQSSNNDRIRTNTGKVSVSQGLRNIANAHGGAKGIAKGTARKIGGVAKFATKKAFTGAGIAVGVGAGLASGQGVKGVIAGAAAGKAMGANLGRTVSETPGNVINTAKKVGSRTADLGRTISDEYHGTTDRQDAARARAFMKDEKVEQEIRNQYAKDHGGMAPTSKQLKEEKESLRTYVNEGLTDTAEIYRAKKAEKYVDRDQAAKIARLAKERKITSKELGDEKQYNAKVRDFTQEFMDKKGLDQTQARASAEHVLNVMKAQVGQQHNLKPKSNMGTTNSRTTSAGTKGRRKK